MPPFLSVFRSRTNSLLDNITGIIPDSPSDSTSKDNSLTCRKCGNRFRDRLELSSHFNLLPNHSDYADSYNYDSFTRPKGRRAKSDRTLELGTPTPSALLDGVTPSASFSETQAYYAVQNDDKEQDASTTRPALLRKFPALSSHSINLTGDQQPQSPPPTDYADSIAPSPRSDPKGKGKQRAMPRLRRDDSFQYGQPLASSDEEDAECQSRATSSSTKNFGSSTRSRAHSASVEAMASHSTLNARPRSSTSSNTSKTSRALANKAVGQAPPLPPKIPMFERQDKLKQSYISSQDSADDTDSIDSDASFRTAGSTKKPSEKTRLKQSYAARDTFGPSWGSPSASSKQMGKQLPPRPRERHASESNLLLESMGTSHDDAPPSYYELHGDADPFDDLALPPRSTSRHFVSRSDGFATVPTSPVSRCDPATSRRPRRSTNAWPYASSSAFPVTFSRCNDLDTIDTYTSLPNTEDDLYNSSPVSPKAQLRRAAGVRPSMSSKLANGSLPPSISSSSFSSSPSPTTPKTPFAFLADAPLSSPPPTLSKPHKASAGSSRRIRQSSRAKSDAAAPSTRCPTCFVKFATLEKTLEHLDNSDCGAVEFESGIM
ncbi:hypothetical protein NDA11_002875 [Ustilago hordei]|uniref:C2H2-type domain-containing protein n=1 Tax=Ustilago hordei TaxID=120017 RepID=I2FMQ6_USTHO|nr:uncharacterized protein UHO2_04837 [Ustilago hordei]KAJ1041894.1 hypothetical protein NDA10_006329 [Ustilago hordei]KAJ1595123.1 hypothetical protein NDA11_002875 [Ustilago hordei]KAJ1596915.1 hypothetical protein NDA14_000463 [Ustilago hordei]UTT89468.1 hypothetical protein NDA17_003940 [Ustilago hordei]CCF48199.1 uncharacterized protein UHOR_05900 [Ustilago hordei]